MTLFRPLILLLLLFATLPSSLAQDAEAVEETAQALAAEDLQALLNTLEDPLAREAFLARLRTLAAVQDEAASPAVEEENLATGLLEAAAHMAGELSEQLDVVGERLAEVPDMAQRLWAAVQLPETQRLLLEILGKVTGIFLVALLGAFVLRRLLSKPAAAMQQRPAFTVLSKSLLLFSLLLLRLLPLLAFVAVAYLVLPLVDPRPVTRLVLLALVNAHLLAQGFITIARSSLAVDAPRLRPYPLNDNTAAYIYVWLRRLTLVIVYGYFLNQALLLIGFDRILQGLIVDLTGFLVVLLFLSLILQNRGTVAAAIRGGPQVKGVMGQLRGTLALLWHLLAMAYVIGVFVVWAFEVRDGFSFLLRSTLLTVLIALLLRMALLLADRGVEWLFRLPEHLGQQYLGLEERTDRYRPVVTKGVKLLLCAIGLLAVLEAWGVDATSFLATPLGHDLLSRLAKIVLIVALSFIIWEFVSVIIERRLMSKARSSRRILTLLPLLKNLVRLVIIVLASMIVLSEIGMNIGPLLASAGVIGLAVGFGAQTLVRDLITGFFVVLEDIIAVGDWVEVGSHNGIVESMTIRTLRLRDLAGNLRIVPFGEVSSVHKIAHDFSHAVIVIPVSYREDSDRVMALLRQVGDSMYEDPEWRVRILAPLEVHGVVKLNESSVDIRVRFKCAPMKGADVQFEFQRRAKKLFDEQGVEIPFPTRTIYFGEDTAGHAPPLRVKRVDETSGQEDAPGDGGEQLPAT